MFFSLPLGFSTDPARVWREGCCGFPASLPGLENIWLLREFVTREFDGIKVDLGFTAVNYPWLLGNFFVKKNRKVSLVGVAWL